MTTPPPPEWNTTRAVWRSHPGYVMAWGLNVVAAAALGISGMAADPTRFQAPTYDGLRDLFGIAGWGSILAVYALWLVIAAWMPTRITLIIFATGGVAYGWLAIMFAAGLSDPRASPWGPIVFGLISCWQVTQAAAYSDSHRRAGITP